MTRADRPVLVFAHYFGGSARSWDPLTIHLRDAFDCVAPDLPGFGGTAAFGPSPSLDRHIDRFMSLAADRPWVAVGHSMGGKIALGAAARSETMKSLILIAPSPPTPEPMTEKDRRETLESFGDRAAAERSVGKSCNRALPPATFQNAVDDLLRVDRSAWRWWLEHGSREDISDRTARLKKPTLIIHGDADQIFDAEVPARIASGLSDARRLPVPGGGHFVSMEQPNVVAEAIAHFLDAR